MKILFPIGIFYPATIGGPSSSIYWHTCYLRRNGVEPYIVTTNCKLKNDSNILLNRWLTTEAGCVIYCKTRNLKFSLCALKETLKKIRHVDIIHYTSAYYSNTVLTIIVCLAVGKKVVLSPRGEFFVGAINNQLKRFVIGIYRFFYKKILFHATSIEESQTIEKLFPNANIIIQPNFIDVENVNKTVGEKRNIVFLGIIYEVKKIENLIKAVVLSSRFKFSNHRLLIAGLPLVERDKDYLAKLVSLVARFNMEDKIKFVGEVYGEEKARFLKEAYVLVLPSESENFGNVVAEALSHSTPVIASRGAPWRELQDRNIGWWVNNDPNSLKDAIDEALGLSEEEYYRRCKESFKLVSQKYNINTSPTNRWIELYYKLLQN